MIFHFSLEGHKRNHFAQYLCFLIALVTSFSKKHAATASHPDQFLSTPELIEKYGYPAESHRAVTEDGYILTMHRIPYSPRSPAAPNKPVVFLQHGLIASSADWIILGPEKSLGYLLADAGYDVWLGNFRGNRYSKNHTSISYKNRKFWDFSWHEMGVHDIPTMMDYVLQKTQKKDLNYVGLSMGATAFFVMTSLKPEYNAKVRIMVSLGGTAFMKHATSPLTKYETLYKQSLRLLSSLGPNEILSSIGKIADTVCSNENTRQICANVIFMLCGYDPKQLNESLLPILLSHSPAGASIKSLSHYLQEMRTEKFLQYDYGKLNMQKYKQTKPPEYNLKAVTAPIALFYGENDPFANPTDTKRLSETLPNVVEVYRVPWDTFNHVDFIWANDVKPLVNDKVIYILQNFQLNKNLTSIYCSVPSSMPIYEDHQHETWNKGTFVKIHFTKVSYTAHNWPLRNSSYATEICSQCSSISYGVFSPE